MKHNLQEEVIKSSVERISTWSELSACILIDEENKFV